MVNKEQNRPGNWTARGKMAEVSQSAVMSGSETLCQSSELRETLPNSPELAIESAGDLGEDNSQLAEPVPVEDNSGSGERNDSPMKPPAHSNEEGQKSPDRLEISTTLPDINMSQL